MGKIIGYAKLGRSMPLTLERCGNLGGDVEMVAVVKEMALRHPDDTFVLIGRNTGERPTDVNLPSNVVNPWTELSGELRRELNQAGLNHPNLTIPEHLICAQIFDDLLVGEFEKLDAMVMWIGQHGTSNSPIPKVDNPGELTKPQDAFAYYAGYLLRGINRWRDARGPREYEEVCLNADARNRHKMRDLKWPLRFPVLAQYAAWKWLKHERYGDSSGYNEWCIPGEREVAEAGMHTSDTWRSKVHDVYSRLEINGLRPGTPFGDLISFNDQWENRRHFGLFINEARAIGIRPELTRRVIMRDWVMPLEPYFIHGTWSKEAQESLGVTIVPAPWANYYPRLHSVRCTLTTPSSGSGWATAKPWEAFAAGTVCFFHPQYDTQNNILSDAPTDLAMWLRVSTAEQLTRRIRHLNSAAGRSDWEWIVATQRQHFETALADLHYMKMIEERIYGP